MSAKKKARTERLEAKKAAIAEQQAQFAPETDPTEEEKAEMETKEDKTKGSKEEAKKENK